jgi:hypothetical protein
VLPGAVTTLTWDMKIYVGISVPFGERALRQGFIFCGSLKLREEGRRVFV